MQLGELQTIEADLREMGYQIVALSADRPAMLEESLEANDLNFTLLSDSAMTAAVAFGLAFRVPESTVERYLTVGIDLDAASGRDHHVLPVPAVFIVGTDGVVRYQYVDPNYRRRLDARVLLAAARSEMERMSDSDR